MNTTKLRLEFHKLIDDIKDETILESFFSVINDLVKNNPKKDIIDELNLKQRKRLIQSLKQSKNGEVISHKQMKKDLVQWLTK